MTSARSGRQVYCVVTDKYGQTVKTNTVTLTMAAAPLTITQQPQSVTVKNGETAAVSFTAEGNGLTYTWYYAAAGSTSFSKTTSFTSNSYSVAMNESRDGRQVYCVVTDQYGQTVKTDVVTLNMAATPLAIVTQPKDAVAAIGSKATVTVKAEGSGLKYAWYFAEKGSDKFTLTTSFTSNTYSVSMTEARSGRRVYCVITDSKGNSVTTDTVTLSAPAKPVITVQPQSVAVNNGEMAVVSFEATGEGLTYKWYYAAKGSSTFKATSSFTGPEYSVEMTSARAGRRIYCVVTDQYGQTVQTNTVTLNMG